MKNLFNAPLTEEEMTSIAPSIFAKEADSKVSDKYSFIPTTQILSDLAKENWLPYDVSQRNSKHAGGLYTKHMVRLRNENLGKIDDIVPEIILTNSHDGRNAFNLHAGLFRLVCSNGLVIADQTFEQIKIKHQWYDLEDVKEMTDNVIIKIPAIINCVKKFKSTELTEQTKKEFAKKAVLTRWKKGQEFLSVEDLLTPYREEDRGNELWKVFNVLQEKVLNGGITYNLPQGRSQTVRALTNIDQKLKVNKELWELAEEFVS
tara:strand:+ start:7697 stop:8479 length:783 start_codon:yes stop_codon:yes gene_type:complete